MLELLTLVLKVPKIGGGDLFGKVGCPSVEGKCEVEGEEEGLPIPSGVTVSATPQNFSE